MKVVSEIPELRESIATLREAGGPVALVPTMGNIHAGHLSLVRRARADCAAVAVSLYVNPFQFGAGEDLVVPGRWRVILGEQGYGADRNNCGDGQPT